MSQASQPAGPSPSPAKAPSTAGSSQQMPKSAPAKQPSKGASGSTRADDEDDASEYVPGAASLSTELDKQIFVVLRDGRYLLGWLRSYDQFGNIVLEHAVEMIIVQEGAAFATVDQGILVIRGENIALLGDVADDYLEAWEAAPHRRIDPMEAVALRRQEQQAHDATKARLRTLLHDENYEDA
eukprot:c25950_g1_i1.p1 GENE.c25950_g1_i1~~c25950_g1_i1.p1  ORF type:complete len:183 (+),score=39.48 c25950_g1_i1:153-701(+)